MTNRHVMKIFALLLLVALMSLVLLSCAPGSAQQSGQQINPQTEAAPDFDERDPMLPGLEGIPPDQLFDHFLGGQFTMTDVDGAPFTMNLTPGTVSSISASSIAITPNGQTTTQSFNITSTTIVRAAPGRGSVQALVEGDKVVIVTRDESQDAILVAKHGPMFHRRMMHSIMGE